MDPAHPDRLLVLAILVWTSAAVVIAIVVGLMIHRPPRLWRRRK
jgi:hypothetical protein